MAVTRPPIVAVTGRRLSAAGVHDGPSHLDALELEVYFAGYADRLAAAGAAPVYVPSGVAPTMALACVDALVLTGGSDVDPALYGRPALPTSRVDRARDERELALLAAASFVPGSLLHEVYGPDCAVNSRHHQAIDRPGAGVVCVGRAPDGVVEAVELTGRAVVGV